MGYGKIVGDNAQGEWMWKNDQAKIPYDFIDAFEDKLAKKHMKVWASCHAWILSFAMLLVQCG